MKKIEEMFAFISEDATGEGLIGMNLNGTFMPFVAADKERMESLRVHAKQIEQMSGQKVKLIRLSVREELEF